MLWIGILVAVAAIVAVAIFVVRKRGSQTEGPSYHYFKCPSCSRRLRYLTRQAGHKGLCPTCRKPLTFPVVARPTS